VSLHAILIAAGTILAVGCAVLALAMAKAASLADQRHDRLLRDNSEADSARASGTAPQGSAAAASASGATDPVLAVAPDQLERGREGDADEVNPDRVTPAEAEVEAHAATAGEPTRTDLLLTAIDRLRTKVERAEEQRAAAEARYTRLAGAMVNLLDACEGFGSWGVVEAAVIAARKALGEAE